MRILLIPLLVMALLLFMAWTVRRESGFLSTVLVVIAVAVMVIFVLGFLGYIGTG